MDLLKYTVLASDVKSWIADTTSCKHCTHPILPVHSTPILILPVNYATTHPTCTLCTTPCPLYSLFYLITPVYSTPTPSPSPVTLIRSTFIKIPSMKYAPQKGHVLIYLLGVTTPNMFSLEHSPASCPDIFFQSLILFQLLLKINQC